MGDELGDPGAPVGSRSEFRKKLKIAAATLGLGPLIGGWAVLFAEFLSALPHFQMFQPDLLRFLDDNLRMLFSLQSVLLLVFFAYPPALESVSVAALLAPCADYFFPARVPRRMLGIALGGACGWVFYTPMFQGPSRALCGVAGAFSGFFVAWICQKAGWTKSIHALIEADAGRRAATP